MSAVRTRERRPSAPITTAPRSTPPPTRRTVTASSSWSRAAHSAPRRTASGPSARRSTACRRARWTRTSGAPKRSWSRDVIDAPSCAPRQLRKAASCAGAPAASTASPTPRRRRALTALGHSEMPAPISSSCGARSSTSTSRPARCSAIAVARPAMPAPMTRARSSMPRRLRVPVFVRVGDPAGPSGPRLGSATCSTAERRTVPLSRASSPALGPRGAARWSSGAIPGSASRRCSGTRPTMRRGCGCCAPWGSRPSPSSRSPRCTSSCGRSSTS